MGYELERQEIEAERWEAREREFRRCHRAGLSAEETARLLRVPRGEAMRGLARAADRREPLQVACDACGCELRTAIADEGGFVAAVYESIELKYGPLAEAQV